MGVQFEGVGALGTEASAGDGRLGVAFDRDQLALLVIRQVVRIQRRNRGKWSG